MRYSRPDCIRARRVSNRSLRCAARKHQRKVGRKSGIRAGQADRNVVKSMGWMRFVADAGSAWARLPPRVPRLRIARWATWRTAARSTGNRSRTVSETSICRWRTSAPNVTLPSPSSMPDRPGMWFTSTRSDGCTRRKFSIGTRLWPPARSFASPRWRARSDTASSTLSARAWSKGGGFMGRGGGSAGRLGGWMNTRPRLQPIRQRFRKLRTAGLWPNPAQRRGSGHRRPARVRQRLESDPIVRTGLR